MLFKPELCQAILEGRKTQTRRLARGWRDWWGYDENGAICCVRLGGHSRMTWRVGNTYAIQPGWGKKAIGHFSITAIHREMLQDITPAGILAEGIDNGKVYHGPGLGDYTVKSVGQLRHEFVALWTLSIPRRELAGQTTLKYGCSPLNLYQIPCVGKTA